MDPRPYSGIGGVGCRTGQEDLYLAVFDFCLCIKLTATHVQAKEYC